ncbi:MAG: site-specific integrase [Prevotella sp.]|jgi:site-specific recombinase XerD|nr:site-specific integrase [Prevotella sp.]MDR2001466.1 site-specific integrase [Prevotella sp.]
MATLKFILRKSRRGDAYTGKVCARIIHARRVRVQSLGINLYLKEWDEKGQEVVLCGEGSSRSRYLEEVAAILRDYRVQFDQVVGRLESQGRYALSDIVLDQNTRHSLSGLLGFSAHLSRGLLHSGQDRTARAYRTAVRMLISFNKMRDIPLKHINACLIKEFETYLKDCGKAMNTISYHMRMLRAIYWKAVKERLIKAQGENPFGSVFTGFEQTRKRALDSDKLKDLHQLDFSALLEQEVSVISTPGGRYAVLNPSDNQFYDKGLYDCWRYFFFCFLARGMSFVDMAYLRKENIRQGVICYYRKKTGQKIEISVSPALRRIIDSFAAEVRSGPYLFPVIRDKYKSARLQYESGLRVQNRRLKKISALAGLECRLSTHVSRHSWATIGKKQNLPLWVISEGLGHSSEKMTYTYLASFDRSTLDNANERITMSVICPAGRTGSLAL